MKKATVSRRSRLSLRQGLWWRLYRHELTSLYFGADFLCLHLPSAEIAVMGTGRCGNIIFRKEIMESRRPNAMRQEKVKEYIEKYLQILTCGCDPKGSSILLSSRKKHVPCCCLFRDGTTKCAGLRHVVWKLTSYFPAGFAAVRKQSVSWGM